MAGERIVLVLILGLTCLTHGEKVNIALKKPAWTNLGHLRELMSPGRYVEWTAGKAVDGDNDISRRDKTCFYAAGSPSDWSVDLGDEYQLYDIRVYMWNYTSTSWKSRTANSIIYLDNNTSRVCYTFPDETVVWNNPTDVICNDTARVVTIRNPGNGPADNDALNICEVEIYGCSAGTYGIDCTDSCHCASPPCDRWTGVCSGDCVAGYRGNKCDTTCGNTHYGVNCKEKCADRKCNTNTASCDRVIGSCDTGCLQGWMGTDCTEECGNQHYGSNCSSVCADRQCEGNSSCDHITGSCDNGCMAGWEGTDCTQACSNTAYGVNCKEKCGDRKCNTTTASCDRFTGSCDTSCLPGWMGTDCTEACPSGTYGPDCSSICGKCTGDNICNHVTGSCPGDCKPGWGGWQCKDTCSSGKYGVNCKKKCDQCNGTCDVVDGHCPGGCVDGYCGTQCQNKLEGTCPGQDTVTTGVIGAVIGAVIMFGVCGGIHLCLVRCGRLRWVKPHDHQNQKTEMDDVTSQTVISQTVSEQPQSESERVYNNDYAVLDVETKSDSKDYDVIKNKHYENT